MTTWVLRACAVFFVIAMLFASYNGFVENHEYAQHALKAPVEPINGYTETTTTKSQLGIKISESKEQSAQLYFTSRDGQRVRVNRRLPSDVLAELVAGRPVFVEYLPADPYSARLVGQTAYPVTCALFALAIAALAYFYWQRM